MDSYTNFAAVYDTFMDQEPYDKWADNVCSLLEKFSEDRFSKPSFRENPSESGGQVNADDLVKETSGSKMLQESTPVLNEGAEEGSGRPFVVDLGCGTGKLTEILAARGYDMLGIDLSGDMLSIAMERKIASGSDIIYSQQDMRDFELYGPADAMVSVGDSVNYLLEESDIEAMFRCVEQWLVPGGVFVFDYKTIHLYRDVIGDRTIAEDRGDCAFIWDNYYEPDTCINEYDLAVFVAEDEDGQVFRRFDEVHRQRGYETDRLRRAAEAAGLIWLTQQDSGTGEDVTKETERALAVVKKPDVE